jgi:glycosyltransferase involved in cell wall biosynthesis
VAEFDLVVVRGRRALAFFAPHLESERIEIIPGSISIPSRLPQGQRKFDLIYVGRLEEIKQPEQVVEVVDQLRKQFADIKVVMVGDGELGLELKRLVEERGLEKNLSFLGKRTDVPALLAKSKVFVLTSRSEGLSIAMAEAMAAGAVPVVPDVGDLRDLIRNRENGFVVPPNTVLAYAARITEILRDDRLRAELSRSAYRTVTDYSSLEIITEKWNRQLEPHIGLPERTP